MVYWSVKRNIPVNRQYLLVSEPIEATSGFNKRIQSEK